MLGQCVQIYEIQDTRDAEIMIELGVDRIGSVLVSSDNWKVQSIRDVVRMCKAEGIKSSIIPLFSDLSLIQKVIEWYEPDVIHFCEMLSGVNGIHEQCHDLIKLQEKIKKECPEIIILRSIPIGEKKTAYLVPTLKLAEMFEPVSDEFLTDTLIIDQHIGGKEQPVTGFVGITGITCDIETARSLVEKSEIPVIFAGGLSPDNVYDAIVQVGPYGVDSCTQTNLRDNEGKPVRFRKDPEKVRQFVEEARRAFKKINET